MQQAAVNIVDVNEANFQQVMFEESAQRMVLLDFWAHGCTSCKALTPVLEKIASELGGQVLLAKINADEQPNIVAQFGVRNFPTIAVVKNGQPVDALQGAQPEGVVREFLQKHLPEIWEAGVQQAQTLIEAGEYEQALTHLHEAYKLSGDMFEIGLIMANCYLHLKRAKEAQALLEKPTMEQQLLPQYKELMSRLELMLEAADTPAILDLQTQLAATPDNLELKYELAIQFSQVERVEEALQAMLELLQKDRGFKDGAARKTMLDILNGLGKGDPLAARYQRKLFSLMY